jgi:hypothetical protein
MRVCENILTLEVLDEFALDTELGLRKYYLLGMRLPTQEERQACSLGLSERSQSVAVTNPGCDDKSNLTCNNSICLLSAPKRYYDNVEKSSQRY